MVFQLKVECFPCLVMSGRDGGGFQVGSQVGLKTRKDHFDSKIILTKLKFIIHIIGSKEELEEDCDNDLCSPV